MQKKSVRILLIVLASILILVLLVGVCSYTCFNYIMDSVKNMQIVVEDLQTGSKKQVTVEGINLIPSFSESGDKLYFINRPGEDDATGTSRLMIYSLKSGTITSALNGKPDNLGLTTSVLRGNMLLGYDRTENLDNICVYSIRDRKVARLTSDSNKKTEARFSPDGRWVSYIEEDAETSRSNLCVMPSSGGRKNRLTGSTGMLSDIKIYSWLPGSKGVAYIDFVSLKVMSLNGDIIAKIDLTGLTNFKNLIADPRNPDRLYLVARDSSGNFSFQIYAVSINERKYRLWKDRRSFWEMHHAISPDGTKLAYSMKSEGNAR